MKQRYWWGWLLVAVLATGCATIRERLPGAPTPYPTALPTVVPAPSLSPLPPTVEATHTAPPPPTTPPTPTTAPSPTPLPTAVIGDLALAAEDVVIYPVPQLYSGDRATFQVLADVPETIAPEEVAVNIFVNGERLVDDRLGWRTLGGDVMGLYEWSWDVGDVVGEQQVRVVLDPEDTIQIGDENPDNNVVNLSVIVQPLETLPPLEQGASWVKEETNCCRVYAVSGTAAGRDLRFLATETERAVNFAAERLGETPRRRLDVFFVDRVIGQGGYAGSAMVVSYLDRDYAGEGLFEVLVHESAHLLDRQFAPSRITFMAEGIAVWVTGGHYKQEDIDRRVAALMTIGEFVPLVELIDNFYPTQHEIGYLEAGGFISYLVERFGWERVKAFHADVKPVGERSLSVVVNNALQRHFGLSLTAVESDWLAHLETVTLAPEEVADLEGSIRFYQMMRRYQQTYDPTAYFLRAWLPFPQAALEQGVTADLSRHPNETINVALETMLVAADASLRAGDYVRLNTILNSVERVLENGGLFLDPLAASYLGIVESTAALGYEAQGITLAGDEARVVARDLRSTRLTQLNLVQSNQRWLLAD